MPQRHSYYEFRRLPFKWNPGQENIDRYMENNAFASNVILFLGRGGSYSITKVFCRIYYRPRMKTIV